MAMKATQKNELGIILKTQRCRESDIKCYILTTSGVKIYTATGAQKQTAKLKSAIQLFTIAEFTTVGTRITGAHVIQLGSPIARDINRYYLACSICETLLNLKNTDDQIMLLTARTMEHLAHTSISAYKIFINFYTKLLVLLGYDIDISDFKSVDHDQLDNIQIDLTTAKQHIKALLFAYQEHLSIQIPHVEIF